jgi:xylose dehydrogenase (NAD/NADP)
VPDDRPVRWGILSTANINRKVIPGAKASPKVELVGVASRTQERAEQYASWWEIPRAYGSYDALLGDDEIDAVYISLPNTLHCEWSVKAMEAGKHVLCEKPLSRHPDEVAAAFDAADRTGRLLSEAFMWRHNPQTARLKELVEGGAIGELRLVRSTFSYSLYDEANIRLRTEVEGGALMDVGCYNVSASRFFGGEPERVFAEAWYGPTGTDWVFTATMRLPRNVIATFDCGTALTNRDELEAIGSEGSLFVDDPWHCLRPGIELRRDGEVERIELEQQDSYRLELENMCDAIRGRGELLLARDDAIGQARALEALHTSASTSMPQLL